MYLKNRHTSYRVDRHLFAVEQENNLKTDVFLYKARSKLSHLPTGNSTENVQLDLVYGLLNRKTREKVPHDSVQNYSELLSKEGLAEETFATIFDKKTSVGNFGKYGIFKV